MPECYRRTALNCSLPVRGELHRERKGEPEMHKRDARDRGCKRGCIDVLINNKGIAYNELTPCICCGGRRRDRTADIQLVRLALSQLSYSPKRPEWP